MNQYETVVQQLKVLLPEYLSHKQIKIGTPKQAKAIHCLNPAHPDKHPSMRYDFTRNNLHCFSCGANYDLFELIAMDYPECDTFPKQVRKACEIFGKAYPETGARQEKKPIRKREKYKPVLQASEKMETAPQNDYLPKIREEAARYGFGGAYFYSRGISAENCDRYMLYQTEQCAVIPIFSGECCTSYCERALDEKTSPRYKNSKGPIGIFNADYLKNKPAEGILVITESAFDALSAEECGFHAIGLCGVSNVRKFLTLCAENPTTASQYTFISAGDQDEAGQKMNLQVKEGLEELGLSCAILELPADVKDLNELLVRDQSQLTAILSGAAETDRTAYLQGNAASALEALLDLSIKRSNMQGISTGFTHLDGVLDGGFYPGLYVLGAISSLGKTSFLLHIANEISARGEDVLYFSLEMSKLELVAKSLSSISHQITQAKGTVGGLTTRQILRYNPQRDHTYSALFNSAAQQFKRTGQHLFIKEGIADIGTMEIRAALSEHKRVFPNSCPVVMVDYLQILKPDDPRATDKQNTDRNIVALKRLSRDFSVPVVVVSSFNRENYRNVVSMESFKESGAVEYSSDVLIGLQFAGAGLPGFDMNQARQRSPRAVELVMLKNRNGIPFAQIEYAYLAKYGVFQEGKKIK